MSNIELIHKWTDRPRNVLKWIDTWVEGIHSHSPVRQSDRQAEWKMENQLAAHRAEAYRLVERLTR